MVQVGERYELIADLSGSAASGYGSGRILQGETVKVTKATDSVVWLRGKRANKGYYDNDQVSIVVYPDDLEKYIALDPNAPKPRKVGEKPEGDHIDADDPRIQWIFVDAAKIATRKGHCSVYDDIADELGVPGRERSFTIKRTVNGFEVSKKFTARSKKLAEAEFDKELVTALG